MQETKPDFIAIDAATAQINALFLDFIVDDISNAEWNQLQNQLTAIIQKIRDTEPASPAL